MGGYFGPGIAMGGQKRLPKFRRVPESLSSKRITERSIAIIETIGRYRFITTKDILRLVGGNEDVTHRHLQRLYHRDLVSRFILPTAKSGEFIYFLDNAVALRELAASTKLNAAVLDWEQIKQNRAKYAPDKSGNGRSVGQFLFIQHELMISGFRADLELACRKQGRVQIERWMQGAPLWNKVQARSGRTLPHRPDAFFTLYFPNAAEGQQRANFFYEADRATSNIKKIRQSFEAHLRFILTGKYTQEYGVKKIRAVLVETVSAGRARQMKRIASELAAHEPLAGMLFWFTNTERREAGKLPTTLSSIWEVAADERMRSLLD